MSTSERIERAEEMVSFWDGALRTASTQERIDLCREQLKEAREQLKEANAIYLASMNQQQAAAPAVNIEAAVEQLPHPSNERKRRWDALNPVLKSIVMDIQKKSKDSAPFSSVKYDVVISSFPASKDFELQPVDVPNEVVDCVHQQLAIVHKLYGKILSGKEAKRLQFISVIINNICNIMPGVSISVEESLRGKYVFANGQFEYIISLNKIKICIVEVKKEDLRQGEAQCLIGTEVIAELEGCDTVYSIITDYLGWIFFKNTNENIYFTDVVTLQTHKNSTVDKASLKNIMDLIYGLLKEAESIQMM